MDEDKSVCTSKDNDELLISHEMSSDDTNLHLMESVDIPWHQLMTDEIK